MINNNDYITVSYNLKDSDKIVDASKIWREIRKETGLSNNTIRFDTVVISLGRKNEFNQWKFIKAVAGIRKNGHQCVCSQVITNYYIFQNIYTDIHITVGSECISKLLKPQEIITTKRIMKDKIKIEKKERKEASLLRRKIIEKKNNNK